MTQTCTRCGSDTASFCEDWDCHKGWSTERPEPRPMNGCQTCGGFGNRHDLVAHDVTGEAEEADGADPMTATHRYDPATCRCTCGALDHPEWGVTA